LGFDEYGITGEKITRKIKKQTSFENQMSRKRTVLYQLALNQKMCQRIT
jgi:hypothetical protein